MAKRIDLIDVMFAVHKGELKVVEKNGFFLLEDTISGERVRLNESTVVRCKDCHNCTKSMWCKLLMMDVKADWFCSHGERRQNDATK